MRSTRAAGAIERLNNRAETRQYSMLRTSDERFVLTRRVAGSPMERLSEALELDEFVAFVNAYGPQKAKRVSKLPNVIGFDTLNEPGMGWIGHKMTERPGRTASGPFAIGFAGPAWTPHDGLRFPVRPGRGAIRMAGRPADRGGPSRDPGAIPAFRGSPRDLYLRLRQTLAGRGAEFGEFPAHQ